MRAKALRGATKVPNERFSRLSSVMKLGETEPNIAFGGYPFDWSAVCGNSKRQPRWQSVSRFMAPPPGILRVHSGTSDRENRALIPSSPPIGRKRSRANWPPSIRREEISALSNLRKRVGYCRVRNTSTFKVISISENRSEKNLNKEENESSSSSEINDYSELKNRTILLKMLSNRRLNRLNNIEDTNTDWYTSDFVTECLCWHNVYRQRHRSPPLTLSPELCKYAQEWANTLAHMNIFFYRPNAKDIGQNIYCRLNVKEPEDVTGQEVAGYWYGACRRYNFLKEPDMLHATVNAGHFTQLVWAGTCDVGIGIARSRSGKVMVVANYRPAGNVSGQFQKNVFLPILDCKSDGCTDCSEFPPMKDSASRRC